MNSAEISAFISRQLELWPMARRNHSALHNIQTREIDIDRQKFVIQHNPARAISSGASVDRDSVESRPCFLCRDNRPSEQDCIEWNGYHILLNPYPIFPNHLTIASASHEPQRIAGRLNDMAALTDVLPDMTVFYNGPECGASAPDHAHFQAAPDSEFPIWRLAGDCREGTAVLPAMQACVLLVSDSSDALAALAESTIACMPQAATSPEPMINILMRRYRDMYQCLVVPRRCHRPSNFTTGPDDRSGIFISPASVDMGGVIITPRALDFESMTADTIRSLFGEVCYTPHEITRFITQLPNK